MDGVVAKSTGSWYEVWLEDGARVECRLRGKFRMNRSSLTNPIAVGDRVTVQSAGNENTIVEIHPRENYLLRKATKANSQFQIVASNIDLAVVIATHAFPRTSTGFIDRFLVTCAMYGIEPVIIFNKLDLIGEDEMDEFEEKYHVYADAGYTTLATSMVSGDIAQEVWDLFDNKTTLLFGHSGVGKSTLLNKIIPGASQEVGEISDQHRKGKHTTTFAQMFEDRHGNRIIDTPGVKEFGLDRVDLWKLGHFFRDFVPFIPDCKYNTCLHRGEPQCAVIKAFAEDKIAEFRYENYLNILEDMENETDFS